MTNNKFEVLEQTLQNSNIKTQKDGLGITTFVVEAGKHKDAIKMMSGIDDQTALTTITGLDLGKTLGILYHLRFANSLVTMRVEVPKDNPKIATITDLMPGASFHEKEAADLLGITVEGNENQGHFLLSEYWPKGVYPLRKDVNVKEVLPLPEAQETNKPSDNSRRVKIIVGPQHPALCEPEKFTITAEGEKVIDIEPRIGYAHRGIEKTAESRTYLQDVYLVERICGICNAYHACGFVETVEKAGNFSIPERAKYLRVIALELNRLHSHLLLLGHAGLEIGYESLFQYMWRDREPIMDLIELTSGNRVISSLMAVGGVRRDIKETDVPKIKTTLATLKKQMPFYKNLYENEPTIKLRLGDVGRLSREDAIKLCVVGPIARGSGVDIDVRKDTPYEVYGDIPFKKIVYTEGDAWARMMVRVDEVEESINIIDYALDHLPVGPIKIDLPRSVPEGEAANVLEAPRGELFYYVKSNGTDKPDRVKVRTPTFANLLSFLNTCVGENLADVPANLASLDPCFSCTDR